MNKRIHVFLIMAVLVSMSVPVALAAPKKTFDTITEGEVLYSSGYYAGEPIPLGYDEYGYNYQGHMFKGSYFNAYARKDGYPVWTGDDEAYLADNPNVVNHWAWAYREINLIMKWNDAWLSNIDTDGDGLLDRHAGFDSYIGSGAWETNHMFGEYENAEGKTIKWNYFTKIVAVPADAYRDGAANEGTWYTADGTEIGPDIWGEFATIMEVSNDADANEHGLLYLSPFSAGFGAYNP